MASIDRLLDLIASLFKGLVALCLLAMLTINVVNIFWRGAFGHAFGWVFSWTMLLFVWMLLLGFFVYVRTRRDVVVDIFVNRLPRLPRLAVALLGNVAGILVMLTILKVAPDLLRLQQANMEAIALPIYVRSLPLFVSAFLVLVHFSNHILGLLAGRSVPFPTVQVREAAKPESAE